jgi:lysophospholipase L1-like esterase
MNKKLFYGIVTVIGLGVIYLTVKKVFGKKLPKSMLFVGDSITAIDYKGQPVKTNYPYLLMQDLGKKGIKIDVLAEGGKTTGWQLENLIQKLKTNKYDRIYIYGGINDMFSGISKEKALSNVQKMVDLSKKNGAEPYVIIGYDAKTFMDENKLKTTKDVPTKAGIIAMKNNYIDYQNSIPKTIKGATIVKKFDIPSTMTVDGIHPTPSGQKIIAKSLLET